MQRTYIKTSHPALVHPSYTYLLIMFCSSLRLSISTLSLPDTSKYIRVAVQPFPVLKSLDFSAETTA